jgi:hypothetical protein
MLVPVLCRLPTSVDSKTNTRAYFRASCTPCWSRQEETMRVVAGLTAIAVLIATTGCATSSKDVATTYVSPIQYQSYDCDQLAAEAQRLTGRVQQLGGRLDEAASNDKAIMGVGLILFWPALFALGGTKQQEAEYARLKGEAEALQQAAVFRKCPGVMMQAQTQPGPAQGAAVPVSLPPGGSAAIKPAAPVSSRCAGLPPGSPCPDR